MTTLRRSPESSSRSSGLRVQIPYAPLAVHREDPFHDSGDDRLRLPLPTAQLGRQLQEVAAHLFHRRGQGADLGAGDARYRGRQVAPADARRGRGQGLERPDQPPPHQDAEQGRQAPDQKGDQQEGPIEAALRRQKPCGRQPGFDQADDLAARTAQRLDGEVQPGVVEPLGDRLLRVERPRPQRPLRCLQERLLAIQDGHRKPGLPGRGAHEGLVEDQGRDHRGLRRRRHRGPGAEDERPVAGRAQDEPIIRAARQPRDGAPGDGTAVARQRIAFEEHGATRQIVRPPEPREQVLKTRRVALLHESSEDRALGQETGGDPQLLAGALDGPQRVRRREAHAGERLLVGEPPQEAGGGRHQAEDGRGHQADVDRGQDGPQAQAARRLTVRGGAVVIAHAS